MTVDTRESPKVDWASTIKEYQEKLKAYLAYPVPESVRNGYIGTVADFKDWCIAARKGILIPARYTEDLAIKLDKLVSDYRQFLR
jgi:hypothetical protein